MISPKPKITNRRCRNDLRWILVLINTSKIILKMIKVNIWFR